MGVATTAGAGPSSASMTKSASTASRSSATSRAQRNPATGQKRKHPKTASDDEETRLPVAKKPATSAKKGRLASVAAEEGDSDATKSRASPVAASVSDSPEPEQSHPAQTPQPARRGRGRPRKVAAGTANKAKGSNRKIVESASDKSAPSSPVEGMEASKILANIDVKGKGRIRRGTESSPDVPLSGLPSRAGSRASSRAQSEEGSPIPFVLRELVAGMAEADNSHGQTSRVKTEDSDLDIDMDDVEASAKKIMATHYALNDEARGSVEPYSRQASLAPSVQAPSEIDGLSAQGDEEATNAGTPADELQVDLGSAKPAAITAKGTPGKRKRGRPPKKSAAVPTSTISTRASPMPAAAPVEPIKPDVKPHRVPTSTERTAIDQISIRAQATLQLERQLIEAGRHPLQLEALDVLDKLKAQRLAEFDFLLGAKEQELDALHEAGERQIWIDWEDEKREALVGMEHVLISKIRRLELEIGDSDYHEVMCPFLPIDKPPIVQPIIRLATIDKDFRRGDITLLPSNAGALNHSVLDVRSKDVEDDLRIMGLLPRQVRHHPATIKREKAVLRKFPLGPGPPKAGQRNRKTRFIGSDHPLRQVKQSVSPVKQVKQEVKREVKQEEVPAAPIVQPAPAKASGRRFSLDRTATKAAAKITASKGQSRADAIVVEDTVSPKFTPLTMESLAALEEAEALKARKMAAQGGYYAEMPMFPGRVQPIPAGAIAVAPPPGYYNAPQALPAQQPPPRSRPIVQDNPEKRQGYDGQGRRVQPPPPEAKPPNRAEKARRADLAAQARIQLGLDPPHPHMVRTRFEAGSPERHPPSSLAEEQMRQRGFPAHSPQYAPSDPRAAGGGGGGGGGGQQQRVSGGSNSARQPPGAAYYRAHPPHPEHILGWAQDGTPYYAPTMPPGYAHYRDPRAYYPPGQPLHPPPQPGKKASGEAKQDQASSQQQAPQHHHHHHRHHHHPNAAPQKPRVVSPQDSMNPRQQ